MSSRLELHGLDELRRALHNLPETLAMEASAVVGETAQQAGAQIQADYPQRTTNLHPGPHRSSPWYPPGNLRAGVRVTLETNRGETIGRVISRSPHSHLFEYGTAPRSTRLGSNRGRMPKGPDPERMIPVIIRARQRLTAKLVALVRATGFEVSVL